MIYSDTALWGLPDPDTQAGFYADVPAKRFFAWLLDSMVIFALSVLMIPLTFFAGLFVFPLLWFTVGLVYRIVTVTRRSATPGMRLMGIELRNSRGESFDLVTASLHTILYSVMLATLVLQVISIVLMLTGPRAQGLHDMLLGTAAINRPGRN